MMSCSIPYRNAFNACGMAGRLQALLLLLSVSQQPLSLPSLTINSKGHER